MDNEEIWVTREKQKIPVGQMSKLHLQNALRMLIRQKREHEKKCPLASQGLAEDAGEWEREFWEDEGRYGMGE